MNPTLSVQPGSTVGHYLLRRPLGRGARGTVFEAEHVTLGRRVALKMLDLGGMDPCHAETLVRRFAREGLAASRIRHPHIVDVFEHGVHEGMPYLVMEYVEGETLARLLARERRLSAERAREILLPILDAVAKLHEAGIVHRDIKPSNVLLARGAGGALGHPKLTDFGVACVEDASSTLTLPNVVLGTPAYLAPELREDASRANERSDQYALAAVLFEMVTGCAPPTGAQRLPKALRPMVARALRRDPARRFDGVDDFTRALTGSPVDRDAGQAGERRGAASSPPFEAPPPRGLPSEIVLGGSLGETDASTERVIRLRRTFIVGGSTWLAFSFVDFLVAFYLHEGSIAHFVVLRVAVALVIGAALVRTYLQPRPTERVIWGLEISVYTAAITGIALMCWEFRGLASLYIPGACLVLVAQAIAGQDPWKRGAILTGIPLAAFFLVLLGGCLVSPAMAAQLHDKAAVATLFINSSFVLTTGVWMVAARHILWSLRQQVHEARNLGRYKLSRRIGRGASGEVWLAHHAALRRDVAVKVLRTEVRDPLSVSRFEREVHATAELTHPNTVRIFDFGATEDGIWYYAMELLEGETLSELVRREGPLRPERAVHLALQASRALAEAHARGIVHRDVKPGNLFVTTVAGEPDFVKVLDFGIVRFAAGRPGAEQTMTQTGSVVGTPAYISPEAALCDHVDARADVYAMGAVLYFMLTGSPPFGSSDGAVAQILAHASQVPELPSLRLGRPVPAEVEAIVMRCLEKKADDRYPDATALAAALARCGDSGSRQPYPLAQSTHHEVLPPAIDGLQGELP